MTDATPRPGRWLRRALLAILGVVAVYAALPPLSPGGGAVMPDLLYCLVCAWVIRAPASAPAVLVIALGLFADLMLSRPPGLGALGLFAATELFRAPGGRRRDWGFLREWLVATAAFAAMMLGMALCLRLTLADAPAPALIGRHVLVTAIAYPIVAVTAGWLTGTRARRAMHGAGARP